MFEIVAESYMTLVLVVINQSNCKSKNKTIQYFPQANNVVMHFVAKQGILLKYTHVWLKLIENSVL